MDAGGAGLIVIYRGFKMAIDGEEYHTDLDLSAPKQIRPAAASEISTADIRYGYCTEFFITHLEKSVDETAVNKLRDKLLAIGDSLVVVGDEERIKVHVHTNVPGKALQYALRLGQLSSIKIDNMREQHESITGLDPQLKQEPQKPMAVVAVAAGDGLGAIFKDFNVDELVSGGQSMNPSAEDIAEAVQKAPSDQVIVLPNNKNIILAAEQAAELTDKSVYVVPSRSFPQGLSAALAFYPDAALEKNLDSMKEALASVKSASVTHAVRDSVVEGETIREGEVIGIYEDSIVAHGDEQLSVILAMLEKMAEEDDCVISIYYGEAVSEEQAKTLQEEIESAFEDFDVELYRGGQAVYDYILSME